MDLKNIPFIQAKHYLDLTNQPKRQIKVIVIHSMEAPEKGETAENVAKYFANSSVVASAHYNIDNNSIVQSVQCRDVAYGAKGMNRPAIHLEHAGYAKQTKEEWKDQYSASMLDLSAQLCGKILCPKFSIKPRLLTLDEIRNISTINVTGFCTHAMVTKAMKIAGGHTDPGPGFPLDEYISLVKSYLV